MHHRMKPQPHPISDWVSKVHPGAPPFHHGTTTQKTSTVSKNKTCLFSHTGTTPPLSTAPSSITNSVLMKFLIVSEPSLAKGLYCKPPKTVNRNTLPSSTMLEIINGEDSNQKGVRQRSRAI